MFRPKSADKLYDNELKKKTTFCNVIADAYSNYGLRHVLLLLLLVAYSALGGFGFRALECDYEEAALVNASLNSVTAKENLMAQLQVRI